MLKTKFGFYDFSEYQLGIFWGISSFSDGRIVFRTKDIYFLNEINDKFNSTIYSQQHKGSTQYVLKSCNIDIDSFKDNNWTERNATLRKLPILDNYKNFIRAYIELHSSLDYSIRHSKKGKYKALRLRIYGNVYLLDEINHILSNNLNIGLKSLQDCNNKTTKVIYYQSFSEISKIYNYIYGNPYNENYWNEIKEKLNNKTNEEFKIIIEKSE